jgi:KDO2-lipid IV(A) lauroyltransferase
MRVTPLEPVGGKSADLVISPKRRAAETIQAWALTALIRAVQLLSPAQASNAGALVARTIGPLLPVSRIAEANLCQALPDLDASARTAIIKGAWDNLGRTAAELPHLASFRRTASGPGWEIEGETHLQPLLSTGQPALFFSGHIGNWEMILPIAASLGVKVAGAYRAASNAGADRVIQALRQNALGRDVSMFPKGASGARAALAHLRAGGSLGLLVDQKMNDGIAVPFFGLEAMTAPALAQFACHFGLPIVPVRVVRTEPARFQLICEAPLAVALTGDRKADVYAITLAVNETLERWIREDPASWLWLHRRWPKPGDAVHRA